MVLAVTNPVYLRGIELGMTPSVARGMSGPTIASIQVGLSADRQSAAIERLAAAMEKLGVQQDEDGPRIDETLRLAALALKAPPAA